MVSVTIRGTRIGESNDTVLVEGNHYFPRHSVNMGLLKRSAKPYTCPWKGTATYYSTEEDANVAWSYEDPKPQARKIAGYLAFDTNKVEITE